jgi:hypothetical protein
MDRFKDRLHFLLSSIFCALVYAFLSAFDISPAVNHLRRFVPCWHTSRERTTQSQHEYFFPFRKFFEREIERVEDSGNLLTSPAVKDFALHQLFRDFLAESPLLKTSKLESVCDKHSTKAMYFIHRAFSSNAEPTKVRIVCLSSVKFHECLEGYLLLLLGYIFLYQPG